MVPTEKSISVSFSVSVAVALRACEAVCGRVRDDSSSGARASTSQFLGCVPSPAQPAGLAP